MLDKREIGCRCIILKSEKSNTHNISAPPLPVPYFFEGKGKGKEVNQKTNVIAILFTPEILCPALIQSILRTTRICYYSQRFNIWHLA